MIKRKQDQDEKKQEQDKQAKEKKLANSFQAKLNAKQQITYDFEGNVIPIKQVNPSKLKILDGE